MDTNRGSNAFVSTTATETAATKRNGFSTGAGRNPTVTEQQKISSPASAVASDGVSRFDLLQCESAFLSGQCSAVSMVCMNDWQYATHTTPPVFKQMNATTNNAISLILFEWVCTT